MHKSWLLMFLFVACAAFGQQFPQNAQVGQLFTDASGVYQNVGGSWVLIGSPRDANVGPLPTCNNNGSLHFLFGGTDGGIFFPSVFVPESQVVIHTVGGDFRECTLGESVPQLGSPGHIFKFDSGPVTNCQGANSPGNYQIGTTCFGSGGKFVIYTTGENHLPQCTPNTPCVFKGAWVTDPNTGAAFALTEHVFDDAFGVQHITYTMDGALEGTYDDPFVGLVNKGKPLQNVYAHFHGDTCDKSGLLSVDDQCTGAGGITIAPFGPQ